MTAPQTDAVESQPQLMSVLLLVKESFLKYVQSDQMVYILLANARKDGNFIRAI